MEKVSYVGQCTGMISSCDASQGYANEKVCGHQKRLFKCREKAMQDIMNKFSTNNCPRSSSPFQQPRTIVIDEKGTFA